MPTVRQVSKYQKRTAYEAVERETSRYYLQYPVGVEVSLRCDHTSKKTQSPEQSLMQICGILEEIRDQMLEEVIRFELPSLSIN